MAITSPLPFFIEVSRPDTTMEEVPSMSMSTPFVCIALSLVASTNALGSSQAMSLGMSSASDTSPCGTRPITTEAANSVTQFAKKMIAKRQKDDANSLTTTAIGGDINVYWNTIKSSSGEGALSTNTILKQIADLNSAFAPGGWNFRLQTIDTFAYDDWYDIEGGDDAEEDMKEYLSVGGANDLNIYSTKLSGGVLGWATFPWDYEDEPNMDGVVIDSRTIEGYGFDGDTGVHEVGHWMGLFHTFQGGCSGPGDYIDDTPAVAGPNYGCPVGIDSCFGGGADLVRNFMDYTDDSCMDSFTNGQMDDMQMLWSVYRSQEALDREDINTIHETSSSQNIMQIGLYVVIGFVGIATVVAGILFKLKRDQDELDAERASEWVGDMSDVDNPIRNDNDAELNGIELTESSPNENVPVDVGGSEVEKSL